MTHQLRYFTGAVLLLLAFRFSYAQSSYQNEIKQYCTALYNSYSPVQKMSGVLPFSDTSRRKWNNLPVGLRARVGTSIGNMNVDQRKLVHRILSAALSSQGYLKATSIMHLDELLNIYYDSLFYKKVIPDSVYHQVRALLWSPNHYYFALFGNPADSNWGFKMEGHHLSVNFTFVNDKLSVTPMFVGTDPEEYEMGAYAGLRVLGEEEDLGIKLIHMLTPAQQKKATMVGAVPKDIITGAESGKRLIDNWGITGAEMTPAQKTALQYIIREFVFNLEYDKAVSEYDKILKAGMDKVYFGWIGQYTEFDAHYYVINGPTFLIEFDDYGFSGKGNHIHAIWREKGNEYGEDVLKQHYMLEKH